MKTNLLLVLALMLAPIAHAYDLERLLPALIAVESSGRDDAVGDNGKAYGPLQIHAILVADVNRIHGTSYRHRDAFDRDTAIEIARLYLSHYCTAQRLGRTPTNEDAARMWNGGPNGHRKKATLGYWAKVRVLIQL